MEEVVQFQRSQEGYAPSDPVGPQKAATSMKKFKKWKYVIHTVGMKEPLDYLEIPYE